MVGTALVFPSINADHFWLVVAWQVKSLHFNGKSPIAREACYRKKPDLRFIDNNLLGFYRL